MQATNLNQKQLDKIYQHQLSQGYFKSHKDEVHANLQLLGVDAYDFLLPETHALPLLIPAGEHINGIVFGRYIQPAIHLSGRGALVATSSRILLIDKKPLFTRCDEIIYQAVGAITYTRVGFAGTIVLHTRMGDISVRTFNHRCANGFVTAVEQNIFDGTSGFDQGYDYNS